MSPSLVPCPSCSRHVAAGELSCPFCGAAPAPIPKGAVVRSLRASRSALVAAGAGTLLATAACSQSTTPVDRDAEPVDAIALDAPPGQPDATADAAPDTGPADVFVPDAPTVQPAYGAVIPPLDGSTDANQP